jgi:hypothetical protein
MVISGEKAFLMIMATVLTMAIGAYLYFRYKEKHP